MAWPVERGGALKTPRSWPGPPSDGRARGSSSGGHRLARERWLGGQVFRVQGLEIGHDEAAVLADQFAVEPHTPAAELGTLDEHEVPVDLGAIAVVGLAIRLSRREVQRSRDLLVEQRVLHRARDVRVESQ